MLNILLTAFLVIFGAQIPSEPDKKILDCEAYLCPSSYQILLMKKVAEKFPELIRYPSFQYPNAGHETILKQYPKGKVLIFGYGSLINKTSAGRSVKAVAVESMKPSIAFGVKRIFNYQASKTDHWGKDLDPKEKAMLNLVPSLKNSSIANGVVMEVDADDLANLVKREEGYDLVPLVVASWKDVADQKPEIELQIAYTFLVASELRNNIAYSSTQFYPVRGYLHMIQEGNQAYGEEFARVWNSTTFLADGTTSIDHWDEETFKGILCTKQPEPKTP